MEKEYIDLFVPGRLCVLGEHSDWAGKYRNVNSKIEKGYAIVTGISVGIYAKVCKSKQLIVKNEVTGQEFICDMDVDKLKKVAVEGGYWSYIAGVAQSVKENFNTDGIEVVITKTTIPEKKGLSSSAAICVLIARAFNNIYDLKLNTQGEMNLAYQGEINTPSRCGRLDQACAFGQKPVLMTFDGDKIDVKSIEVKKPLHFIFADLNAGKNTIKILSSLNRSYPFPESDLDYSIHNALGKNNKEIVLKSIEYIENGEVQKFGDMMNKAQENFDKNISMACIDELKAPVLHKVLNDNYVCSNSYGRKGVGSQGDGCIQILAKDKDSQQKLLNYLNKELNLTAYELTIEPNIIDK